MPKSLLHDSESRQIAIGLAIIVLALTLLPSAQAWGAERVALFGAPPIGSVLDEMALGSPHPITGQETSDSPFIGERSRTTPIQGLNTPGDACEPLDFAPTLRELSQRLQPEVREGFNLGRAGALYAARRQFISVLRQVALAKDAHSGAETYSQALADGLRTLDEADDFVPRGDALEAELDTRAIARSHSTPIVRLRVEGPITPHRALSLYSQRAAERLALAVGGQKAGSMALYGLGKTYARLAAQDDNPHAARKSAVAYFAALEAGPNNYLAANELGVCLAREGRYDQARPFLERAANHRSAPAAVYDNLAMVQRKTGHEDQAIATEAARVRLAQAEFAQNGVSERHGVEWVEPAAFRGEAIARDSESAAPPVTADSPAEGSGWQKWWGKRPRGAGKGPGGRQSSAEAVQR